MKKLLLLLLLPTFAFSQATTETEYNYMKKGYRDVEERGLDVKSSYYTVELNKQTVGDYKMSYTLLRRTKDSSIAGVIIKSVAYNNPANYYCIPAVNVKGKESYGWDLFYDDINKMNCTEAKVVMQHLAYNLAFAMSAAIKRK